MTQFINKFTGGIMYVPDDRVDEYTAAGHKLAAVQKAPEEPKDEAEKPKTKRTRKA